MIEHTTKVEILKGIIEIVKLLKNIEAQNREIIKIIDYRED